MEKHGVAEDFSGKIVTKARKPSPDAHQRCHCCCCPCGIVTPSRRSWATDKVKLALIASFTTVVLAWITHATVIGVTRDVGDVVRDGVNPVERLQTPKNGQRKI